MADRINFFKKELYKVLPEKLDSQEDSSSKIYNAERAPDSDADVNNNPEQHPSKKPDYIFEQNAELQARNRELEEAKKIIEQQHAELVRYSENLEHEINLRAKDLLKSNQELVEQNHQLEQFAFITAHNLRAPVARIQGLAAILGLTKDDAEKQLVIEKMIDSSRELDRVIHDLAKILEIKRGSVENFEIVNLYDKMDRITSMLQDQIKKTKAVIRCNFDSVKKIFSLPQYIESILYNLISNAIKYKFPDRAPEITIDSLKNDEVIQIIVKDNGIGLEVNKHKEKIFGLYQRFHDHVEGKGMGLHLVKTQVESLGGKIEIESVPNIGTTFVITFPYK